MAIFYYYPNNDSTIVLFKDQAGGTTNIYQSIDDPHGSYNDSDYIKSAGSNPSTYIADLQNAIAQTIQSVNFYIRHKVTNAAISGNSKIRMNASNYWTITTNSASWVTEEHGWDAVNPDTSAAWVYTDVDGIQLVSQQSGSALHSYQISAMHVGVNYAGAGMLMKFGWGILPALLSSGMFSHGLMCESYDVLWNALNTVLKPKRLPVPGCIHEIQLLSDKLFVRPSFIRLRNTP